MGIRQIVPPDAVEPVSVDEVKGALRVDHTDDDALLAAYTTSAREWLEARIQSKLALATYEFSIDSFPTAEIRLPFGPVQSVTSIKYDDELGDEQTVDPATYQLDNVSSDPWVFSAATWPVALDAFNAVRIRFVAGYADPALMPAAVRAALFLKVKELYDGEDTSASVHNLLTNYYRMVA